MFRPLIALAIAAIGTAVYVSQPAPMQAQAQTTHAGPTATAVFAGGCFWCVESDFDKVEGVLQTVSGYVGGTVNNPTYQQVVGGNTGHYEAVEITYDPEVVDYATLVNYFFRHVDPTDAGGQFCDRGQSYATAIFTQNAPQRLVAEMTLAQLDETANLPGPIVTPIYDAAEFFAAEDYHQDYYLKNPLRYRLYRASCGRDARVAEVWENAPNS
jgi:peptide-methionine (S)-S-oxide reductase